MSCLEHCCLEYLLSLRKRSPYVRVAEYQKSCDRDSRFLQPREENFGGRNSSKCWEDRLKTNSILAEEIE